MFDDPSKDTPPIFLAVASVVAVPAFPLISPVKSAVIWLALKLPEASLETIVLATLPSPWFTAPPFPINTAALPAPDFMKEPAVKAFVLGLNEKVLLDCNLESVIFSCWYRGWVFVLSTFETINLFCVESKTKTFRDPDRILLLSIWVSEAKDISEPVAKALLKTYPPQLLSVKSITSFVTGSFAKTISL